MDYLIAGLVLFAVGNLVHLEREVAKLKSELSHIKKSLKGGNDD